MSSASGSPRTQSGSAMTQDGSAMTQSGSAVTQSGSAATQSGSAMKSLVASATVKVSSVWKHNPMKSGKYFMFDGEEETAWNSAQGIPQWISFEFDHPVHIHEVHMQFHGGFVGSLCHMTGKQRVGGEPIDFGDFYPEDNNAEQIFVLSIAEKITRFRVLFRKSTDFYGRITLYKVDLLGFTC
ncbi:nuclear receptor 2C2-associated protein-like [Corticium candelabrum]|uniref:nuclear receptor 2C2-associated protein-like n=1 Tax=Corticium candelabrum TaxID=121492 RepID=UPI002E2547B7|nr:nuclear receptor 2C2-associated protein-like [Corticium candelabrum]